MDYATTDQEIKQRHIGGLLSCFSAFINFGKFIVVISWLSVAF